MDRTTTTEPRTDFYTVVHKALRKRLFEATVLAGTTDYRDADERASLEHTIADLVTALRDHAAHEDRFIRPLLDDVLPEIADSLTAEHEEHDRALDAIEHAFAAAAADPTSSTAHRAYRTLASFAAFYLTHLEREEAVQPLVWASVDEARLAAATTAFRTSRSLEQTVAGWRAMLPAMNAPERAVMFRAIYDGAPPIVIDAARGVARDVLGEGAWRALDEALHIPNARVAVR